MSSPRNKLYSLITSLKPAEKRYFKIFASRHTIGDKNKYLILFDVILEMHHEMGRYDENVLTQKLSMHNDFKRPDLHKTHLYKKILASLESFHRSKSINDRLRSFQYQAEILDKKELPELALSLIDKGITLAEKYEKWYQVLQFLELQRSINYSLQKLSTNNNKEREILTKAINLGNYRKLQSRLWKLYLEKGLPISQAEKSRYANLLNNNLMKSEESARSREARILHQYILQFHYGMQGDLIKTCSYGKRLVSLLESDPEFMKADAGMYFRTMFNLQLAYMRLDKHDDVLELIARMRSAFDRLYTNPALKYSIGLNLYINEFETNQKNDPLSDQSGLISDMQDYYEQHCHLLREPNKYLYYWQNATYFFNSGRLHESQDWLNRIIDMKSTFRVDIQGLARILNIIIHLELANKKLIVYFIRSTQRYLVSKNQLFAVEKILLNFIKQLSNAVGSKNTQLRIFKNLNKELQALKLDEQSHQALRMLNFGKWIERKLVQSDELKSLS